MQTFATAAVIWAAIAFVALFVAILAWGFHGIDGHLREAEEKIRALDVRVESLKDEKCLHFELIAKLQERLDSHKKELEAMRNLLGAKNAEQERQPKVIVAKNTRELRALLKQQEEEG